MPLTELAAKTLVPTLPAELVCGLMTAAAVFVTARVGTGGLLPSGIALVRPARTESDLIVVRSTINLGDDLGLRITAEGVEDPATLERLALLVSRPPRTAPAGEPVPGGTPDRRCGRR